MLCIVCVALWNHSKLLYTNTGSRARSLFHHRAHSWNSCIVCIPLWHPLKCYPLCGHIPRYFPHQLLHMFLATCAVQYSVDFIEICLHWKAVTLHSSILTVGSPFVGWPWLLIFQTIFLLLLKLYIILQIILILYKAVNWINSTILFQYVVSKYDWRIAPKILSEKLLHLDQAEHQWYWELLISTFRMNVGSEPVLLGYMVACIVH